MTAPLDPAPRRPGPWSRVRNAATYVGAGGLGLVLASIVMMGLALAQGVHCPGCDQLSLGSEYPRWVTYFHAKDVLLLAGAVVSLCCVPLAHRRRYGVAAVLLAIVALGLTPR